MKIFFKIIVSLLVTSTVLYASNSDSDLDSDNQKQNQVHNFKTDVQDFVQDLPIKNKNEVMNDIIESDSKYNHGKETLLRLTDLPLQEFSTNYTLFPYIKELSLINLELIYLPYLSNFKNLKKLYVSGTKIKRIPKSLFEINTLTDIQFENNPIEEISAFVEKTNLRSFVIGGAPKFNKFPEFLTQNKDLEVLELSDTSIDEIPSSIINLKKVSLLHFQKNKITNIPDEIAILAKTTEVYSINFAENPIQISIKNDNTIEEIGKYLTPIYYGGEYRWWFKRQ